MVKRWLAGVGLVLAVVLAVFFVGYYSAGTNQQSFLEVTGSSDSLVTGLSDLSGADSSVTGAVTAGCENACWTKFYNSPYSLNESFEAAVVDVDLNTYVTGYEQSSSSSFKAILKKYNSCGVEMWTIPITTGGYGWVGPLNNEIYRTSGTDLVLYGTNLYVLANYVTASGSAGSMVATSKVLVSKYDVSGASPALMWRKIYNNGMNVNVGSGIDHQGVINRIYITGSSVSSGRSSGFVASYSATDGTLLWQNNSINGSIGAANDIVVVDSPRSSWAVYVAGSSNMLTIVSKFDLDGNPLWLRGYSAPYINSFNQISYDIMNSRLVVSSSSPYTYTYNPPRLHIISPSGMLLAESSVPGGMFLNLINSLTIFNRKAYTAGYTAGSLNATIRRFAYNSNLSLVQEWVADFSGPGANKGRGVAVDRLGNMYLAGTGQTARYVSYDDAFLRKYTAAGQACS